MKKIYPYFFIFLSLFGTTFGSDTFLSLPADTSRAQADSIMKVLHLKAFELRDQGKYENAEILYREVVHLKESYASDDTFKLANVYGNYAILLSTVWKYDESLSYYDKALEIANPNDRENYRLLLMNKGSLLLTSKDFVTALNYYDQAEKYLLKEKNYNSEALKQIYFNKSAALFLLGRSSDALKYIEYVESLEGLTPNETYEIKLKKLSLLSNIGEDQKFIEIYNQLLKSSIFNNYKLYLEFATFLYLNQNKISEAIEMYYFIENKLINSSNIQIDLLQFYNNLGNCYDLKKMYKDALDNYQKALICIYPGFTNNNIKSNPPSASFYEEAQNLPVFKNKAEVLHKYSKYVKDTSYLSSSLQNCLRSVNIIQKMRYRVTSEQSQFLISKNERSAFNLAQYVALEKYSQTKDKNYLNMAFEVNEKGRSFTLLSAMRNQMAMDFGDVPEKVRENESDLNRQLSLYDELIYKEKQKEEPNRIIISGWEDQLFNANENYKKLLRKLEKEYPEYYRLKYDEEVTDLFDIQKKIDKNTVLVQYSYMDSILIIYTASREKMSATKVNLQPGFEDKCIEFLNLITNQSFSSNVTETYNNYIVLAHELYSIVIGSIKDQLDGVNLIVIPDGAISYLPFDALLTSKVSPGLPDYRHIPYLVKEYSVGYSYSTTIHFNPLRHVKIPNNAILAFAPVYSNVIAEKNQNRLVSNQDFIDLIMLPGVTIEVNNISEILKTDAYYNVSAKESVFKEKAGKYKILHLAMHTIIDNNDPMLSRLVFTQIPDGEEDGLLNTYEIYNMKLNASLTVLSSCSSGYGKIQPGEGVQSLARGFAYAGCPSILMTLWEVADLSTVLVMTDFYEYLKQHKPKPQALRESKLNFLNEADELRSNPFFWASYLVIGDSSPLYPFSSDMAAISALMLILPLGLLGVFYKRYKKEEKRSHWKAA